MEGLMPARNCTAARVLVAEKNGSRKTSPRQLAVARGSLAILFAVLLGLAFAPRSVAQKQPASAEEVQQLRKEVSDLRENLKRLEALLESRPTSAASSPAATTTAPAITVPATAVEPSSQAANTALQARKPSAEDTGLPQYTG